MLIAAVAILSGCESKDVRQIERMPPPVFREPPTDWPTTAPAALVPDELLAGWRNHVLPDRAWQWIVVHHSSTPGGGARKFDAFHRDEPRGWDELGYHFVIGNGSETPDGRVEAGSRWVKQKHGAHCATPSRRFNETGVGVCLVGDFETGGRPTPRQWALLVALCRFLCDEYDIPAERIIGHRQAQAAEGEAKTDCPGKNLDLDALRREVARKTP